MPIKVPIPPTPDNSGYRYEGHVEIDSFTNKTRLSQEILDDIAAGGGGSAHIIKDNGSSETARAALDFISTDTGVVTVTDNAGADSTEVQIEGRTIVSLDGTPEGTRREINFIQGPNMTITVTDDPSNQKVDVEFESTVTGSAGVIAKFDNTDSPVARYDFEENLNDSSGNGHNLSSVTTPVYGEVWPNVIGFVSGAARQAANTAGLTITGDITIEMLCVLRSAPSSVIPVTFFDDVSPNVLAGNVLYQCILSDHATIAFQSESTVSTFATYSSTAGRRMPQFGVPCEIVWRRASNIISFWLNGRQFGANSGTLATPAGGTASKLNVRVSNAATLPDIFGLRIYNSARTDQQIKDGFNATLGPAFGTV